MAKAIEQEPIAPAVDTVEPAEQKTPTTNRKGAIAGAVAGGVIVLAAAFGGGLLVGTGIHSTSTAQAGQGPGGQQGGPGGQQGGPPVGGPGGQQGGQQGAQQGGQQG